MTRNRDAERQAVDTLRAEIRRLKADHLKLLDRLAAERARLRAELAAVTAELCILQTEMPSARAAVTALAALRAEIPAIRAAGEIAADDSWPGIVYYMTWVGTPENLVKIGFTRDLRGRVEGLTWRGRVPEVIAAEPAAPARHYSLETLRKSQFRHLRLTGDSGPRIGRTELFRRVVELDDHMASVREAWPRWRWLCRLPDNAIGRQHVHDEVRRVIDSARKSATVENGQETSSFT